MLFLNVCMKEGVNQPWAFGEQAEKNCKWNKCEHKNMYILYDSVLSFINCAQNISIELNITK